MALSGPWVSGSLGSHDKVNVAIEDVKERQELTKGFPVVRLVKKAAKLRGRGSKAPDELALGQRTSLDALLSFQREFVEQSIPQVVQILIVFKNLIDMNGALVPGLQQEGKSLAAEALCGWRTRS